MKEATEDAVQAFSSLDSVIETPLTMGSNASEASLDIQGEQELIETSGANLVSEREVNKHFKRDSDGATSSMGDIFPIDSEGKPSKKAHSEVYSRI